MMMMMMMMMRSLTLLVKTRAEDPWRDFYI